MKLDLQRRMVARGVLLLGLLVPGLARAGLQDTLTRPLALGDAFRGHGGGNGAIYSNPAALGSAIGYSLEAAYLDLAGEDLAHLSVVDTKTSALGAGLAYTYHPVTDHADDHDARLALSLAPVPNVLWVGVGGQYTWLGQADEQGLSLDAGVLLMLARTFGLGAVAHNLLPATEVGETRSYGLGVAYTGLFTAAFDLTFDPELAGADRFSYHGGLEFLVGQSYPLRVGYEAHPARDAHLLCFGVGAISERAGIQLGVRTRVDGGDEDETSFGVSLTFYL
ncbi:MAG: hypothetical protein RBU45_06735 [Myxococcota bacterium]|jgi:hypothetical protein|nr:hypothetical protein [Myxococcota bacterium]